MVAKFESQRVRSAAAVALPTTTGARAAAAAAAERDPIFSASTSALEVASSRRQLQCCRAKWRGVLPPRWRGGVMEKPKLRGQRGGRRRIDEIYF